MVIININGINGYLFNIDTTTNIYRYGINKYYLNDLKIDILKHLKKNKEIYKEYDIIDDDEVITTKQEQFIKLAKRVHNFHNTKFIKLMKDNIILDNENFNVDELKDGDVINYILMPIFD